MYGHKAVALPHRPTSLRLATFPAQYPNNHKFNNLKKQTLMKKITFLLAVFALAWSTPSRALDLPEAGKDGKIKWYFLQTLATGERSGRVFTVQGDFVFDYPQADYSDYETLARQLWCFETEDGEWYTITNRYDGRKLGVGMGIHGEALAMYDEPQAKFRLRDVSGNPSLESDMPAPGGGSIYLYPQATNSTYNFVVWLVRESNSYAAESQLSLIEYNDTFAPQDSETVTWYNITTAEAGAGGELIADNTSAVDANYKFTVEKKESSDQSAQWRFVATQPGKISIVNRATGNSISTTLSAEGRYNIPAADGKTVVPTTWNILPVSEQEYVIASIGTDNVQRMLNAQTLGEEPAELADGSFAGTSVAWTFTLADTQVGIGQAAVSQSGKLTVENGRITAPDGAKVTVATPDGIVLPASSRLAPGIYLVTVNGKTTKILVH